jgi:hypothetical protein
MVLPEPGISFFEQFRLLLGETDAVMARGTYIVRVDVVVSLDSRKWRDIASGDVHVTTGS